jgi:UDP-N-acetylmuramoyl-L-alanyl-D-glutamate--2,6-diaminopimelate ligase
MRLSDVLTEVPGGKISGNPDADIRGISYSSKTVRPDDLFAALKGEKADGFDFIGEAVDRGAIAVLSEREKPKNFPKTWIQVSNARVALSLCAANFYSHPSKELKVVGITGTKGKTTITYILEEILKNANFLPGVIGTISYRGPGIKSTAERTTPEAPDLQRMMREMADLGATHCVMEVSSHSLELNRTTGIDFDVIAFTNLSGEHLDYHHSMEQYFEAKKKLFVFPSRKRIAVINCDDFWGKKLLTQISMEIFTYGTGPTAKIRAKNFLFSEDGLEMTVNYPAGKISVSSHLLGKPNMYNILASIACALNLGVPVHSIIDGIAGLEGVPGRFEKIKNSLGYNIFVDYAHTDDALKNLLETAKELNFRRIILVFGAGGDRDTQKRPRMGEVAGLYADWTIITSDNPRTEDPMAILTDIEEGIKKTGPSRYELELDRKSAIHKALKRANKGDCVLVAGKGHEDYQIIKDKIFPFKDADVIRSFLKEMGDE